VVEVKLFVLQTGIELSEIFLFIGTILVAFEVVKDIGFDQSLFALPLAYPVNVAMKRIGVVIKRDTYWSLKYERQKVTKQSVSDRVKYILWIICFFVSAICLTAFVIVCTPLMMVLGIGRILDTVNQLLNIAYKWSFQPWEDIYFVATNITLKYMNKATKLKLLGWLFKKTVIQERATNSELKQALKKKGNLPFVAFIGLLLITAGFVLQLFNF
jgi:hypothetical protein